MTRYLYVMDPIMGVNPNADTTFDFMLESQARGVENHVCHIEHLSSVGPKGFARTWQTTVRRPTEDNPLHAELGARDTLPFDAFDVIWMRKDPPVDDAFMLSTMMLDRYNPAKTVMMNTPASLRVASEKLWSLFLADELMPETIVSADRAFLISQIGRMGRGVIKPIGLAGGSGVMVFSADDKNLKAAIDLLTLEGKRPCVLQEYLPRAREGDKRVILLGGEPIGAMLRVPLGDDHRANMHVGGGVKQCDVDDRDREIAAALKPHLLDLGLHFVGIDVIDGKVTEVNVTSPTGVQEIDALDGRTGKDKLSAQVMDYVEGLLQKRG